MSMRRSAPGSDSVATQDAASGDIVPASPQACEDRCEALADHPSGGSGMTAQPEVPGPDTGSYEVIHLGGQAAVVVPVADFLRLRALERAAAPQELEDAEDTAAILEWKVRDAAGQTTFVPAEEARRRLGMPR
jgi:hypothetical protein